MKRELLSCRAPGNARVLLAWAVAAARDLTKQQYLQAGRIAAAKGGGRGGALAKGQRPSGYAEDLDRSALANDALSMTSTFLAFLRVSSISLQAASRIALLSFLSS